MTESSPSDAVLRGRIRECDRLLPRPGSFRTPEHTVPWSEFCDPDGPYLARCVEEWQRRYGFRHRRAGLVLVAFRAGWLACCATVPEHHLGAPLPSLSGLRAVLGEGGRLSALHLPAEPRRTSSAEDWWTQLDAIFAPLAEGLHALGGPEPYSHEYWGNPVGLLGAVLWRLERGGMPGDFLATARELRAATGQEHLLDLDEEATCWARRRTCCQVWRGGHGYCAECVLWCSPRRLTR